MPPARVVGIGFTGNILAVVIVVTGILPVTLYDIVTATQAGDELAAPGAVEVAGIAEIVSAAVHFGFQRVGDRPQDSLDGLIIRRFQQLLHLFVGDGVGGGDIQFFVTRRGREGQRGKCYQVFFHNS